MGDPDRKWPASAGTISHRRGRHPVREVYTPPFEGIDSFAGESFHTSRWPKEKVDFNGKRVGVIGTGATAVQLIPIVAKEVGHMTVFQRTPNYCAPLRNSEVTPEAQRQWKASYPGNPQEMPRKPGRL